ncbi:class II glutamine amidotransferase [Hansschlegelia zhihuaiae]|uniref:Glutamine amidotransferase n=1 Tax=Hansschlegelia zhihuaiae TaxID=405005 RepID=A0A4V1KJH4_9HYPH|nr:glutamine amidotransferase family protein [Hansschlegelia zhihuaiae]RXF74202.1 glutamine amidotransferase [Hansschlegelia zhihuaiae]
MCGIVGLFLKDPSLEPKLGEMLGQMLGVMCDRGPDSAGFAVYGGGAPGKIKLTLRAPAGYDFAPVGAALGDGAELETRATHAVLTIADSREAEARDTIAKQFKDVTVVGAGQRMELYKEVGLPSDVATSFKLSGMSGTHGIGHTRMATESAVTTNGAHPFSTGADQCLVHNGSLSNHRSVRRDLERAGFSVNTDNDSEVAAGYLSWRMKEGRSLGEALEDSLDDLDGFYTFVVGTETGFGVIRDPIACKPAVMAETDQYVAFGSEYRALAGLPGIETAKVWEPEPAKVYFWDRAA